MTAKLSRRAALSAGAALPLAATLGTPSAAAGHSEIPARSDTHRRFQIGGFEVTTLLAGTRLVTDDPQTIFGMNVDDETFAEVSAQNFIPDDRSQFFFTPTLVKTGSETILFDTGLNGAATAAILEKAGTATGDITHVVITHIHGDHISAAS